MLNYQRITSLISPHLRRNIQGRCNDGLPPVGTLEATTGFLATLCAGCGQHLGCVRPRKLGNQKDLTNEGPWGCGRIDGILMNITVMNINEYCIYTYLHILSLSFSLFLSLSLSPSLSPSLSLYKCLAIDIDGTTGLPFINL
jgi:hypothetical protein